MALGRAPKRVGRKPSNRKRSNHKKSPVTEVRDFLQEDEHAFSNTQAERIPQSIVPTATTSNNRSIPAPNSLRETAIRENRSLQAVAQQSSSTVRSINSVTNTQPMQVIFNVPTIPANHNGPPWQTTSRESHSSVLVQQNAAIVRNTVPSANTQSGAVFHAGMFPNS